MFDRIFRRYLAASVIALGFDFGVFMLALSLRVPPAPAAAIGYIAGVVCHWLVSSRAVFVDRVAAAGVDRWHQQALFLGSALVGLAITTAIVGIGSYAGIYPLVAKIIATGVSFQVTYLLRKKVVFA